MDFRFANSEDLMGMVMLLSRSDRTEAHKFYRSLVFDGDVKSGFTYDIKNEAMGF